MTRPPDEPDDKSSADDTVSPDEVFETMEPLEPYTTTELATMVGVSKQFVRRLLETLTSNERIRKKEAERNRVIWIREPPAHTCPDCGREFEIKFLHPILSAVQFCPRCGAQLE